MSHQQLSHQVNPRDVLALDALLDEDEVLLRDTCLLYTSPSPRD